MEKTNINKFLQNTIRTMNGLVYKDEKAFESKQGICYISEGDLDDLLSYCDNNDSDLTDEEIVELGIGETYETILRQVADRWDELNIERGSKEEIARMVFNEVDWCCVATEIDQLTY